jgi:hypothetical protein
MRRLLAYLTIAFPLVHASASAAVNVATANYTIGPADCGATTQLGNGSTGPFTLNIPIPTAAGLSAGCRVTVVNADAGRGKFLSGAPSGLPALLFPGQAFTIEVNGAMTGWNVILAPGRWVAPARTVFYVDSVTGSDANDGLARGAGAAWATPQQAVNVLKQAVDFGLTHGGPIYVQLADGTYNAANNSGIWVNGPFMGASTFDPNLDADSCPVVFKGDAANPSAVVLSSDMGDAVTGIGGTFFCVQDMELRGALSDIGAGGASVIRFGNLILGQSGNAKIRSGHGAAVENYAGTTIHLRGNSPAVFWGLVSGNIYITQAKINIDAEFSVTYFALSQSGGGLYYVGNIVSQIDAVTGSKFAVDSGGYIFTGTNNTALLPGSLPGILNGGFYDNTLHQ